MKVTKTKDYELIAKLNKPVHDLHFSLYPEYFDEYEYETIKEVFKKQVNNENFIFLLLEDEGEAVGFAWIEIRNYDRYPFKKTYRSIYVYQISIVQGKRGSGFGTYLMNHIYQLASDKGIGLVELDYWLKNNTAQQFYEKHGFTKSRETVIKEI